MSNDFVEVDIEIDPFLYSKLEHYKDIYNTKNKTNLTVEEYAVKLIEQRINYENTLILL